MIRGEKREIVHPVNATINAAIHNRFDVEVVDAASGEVKQKAVGYNVICNSIWTRILHSSYTYFNYIQYGGGSGTPSASDTSLFSYIGGSAVVSASDVPNFDRRNGVYSYRGKIQLSPETAVGSTITEVGIAYASGASGNLVTHAMLQDMNGNPISITKTATDIINIYATVYVHFSPSGWDSGYIFYAESLLLRALAGLAPESNFNKFPGYANHLPYTGRGCRVNGYTSGGGESYLSTVFDVQNKRITMTSGRLAVDSDNYASSGIGSILIKNRWSHSGTSRYYDTYSSFQLLVGGSWYPGTQITGEAIGTGDGVTSDFATDFPLVSSATVYVNGVASEDASVDLNVPRTYDSLGFGFYMNRLNLYGEPSWGYLPTYEGVSYPFRGDAFLENPYYSTCGIASISLYGNPTCSFYCSNDFSSWTLVNTFSTGSQTYNVPAQYQNYRYWKFTGSAYYVRITSTASENNIHFSTPPAAGAVITADYFTKTIAKDENHVFDLTVTIQLGEYSEG